MFSTTTFSGVAWLDLPHSATVAAVDDLVERPVIEAFFEIEPEPGEEFSQPRPPVFDVFADAPEITYLLDFFEVEPERGEEFIEAKNGNDSFAIIGGEIVALLDIYEVEPERGEEFLEDKYRDDSYDDSIVQLIDPPYIPPVIGSEFTHGSEQEFVPIIVSPAQRLPLYTKGASRYWKGRPQ